MTQYIYVNESSLEIVGGIECSDEAAKNVHAPAGAIKIAGYAPPRDLHKRIWRFKDGRMVDEGDRCPPTYADIRRIAYPPIEEYIDGLVKGDQKQVEAYFKKCREVKAKFPKPT